MQLLFSAYLLSISDHVLRLSGKINKNYYYQGSINNFFKLYYHIIRKCQCIFNILSGKINDLYYNKMFFNGISNGGVLYQVGALLFYNSVCISGALLFSNTFNNFDNTDPFYI